MPYNVQALKDIIANAGIFNAPERPQGMNDNQFNALKQFADARKRLFVNDCNKLKPEKFHPYEGPNVDKLILKSPKDLASDNAEKNVLLQKHSFSAFIQTSKRSMRAFGLDRFIGTIDDPIHQWPGEVDMFSTSQVHRENIADDKLTWLSEFTSGPIKNRVVKYEESRDGFAALADVRLYLHHQASRDQKKIREWLNVVKLPKSGTPEPTIRKIEILVSIFNSYGKQKIPDHEMRDVLRDALKGVPIWAPLNSWCVNNCEAYEDLSFDDFVQQVMSNHDTSCQMDIDKPPVSHASEDAGGKKKRPRSTATGGASGSVSNNKKGRTTLHDVQSRGQEALKSCSQEQLRSVWKQVGQALGLPVEQPPTAHWQQNYWCRYCNSSKHWKQDCRNWAAQKFYGAGKGGGKGGRGGKGGKGGKGNAQADPKPAGDADITDV